MLLAALVAVVALVLFLGVVPRVAALNQGSRAAMQRLPGGQVLRFQVDGGQAVRAEYQDAHGIQVDVPAGVDIRVSGLKWAVVAVWGQDVGCSVTLNGITESAQGSVDPAGTIDVCAYPGQ